MSGWTTTYEIKATWSKEMVEDLKAYHGIDAEEEFRRILEESDPGYIAKKKRELREKKLKRIYGEDC